MGSGTSLPHAGAQGPEHLIWTRIKISLGPEALGFPGSAGDQSQIPVPGSLPVFPAPLSALPMASDSQDSLAPLPLAHRYLPAGIREFSLPPFLVHPSVPSSVPSDLWDSVAPLSLHLFLMCQHWLRSGSKQEQKLLCASGIFSGKMEKSVQNQELGNPKVSAEEKEQGAHQGPSSQDDFGSKAPLEGSGPFLLPQVRQIHSQGLFRTFCSQVGVPAKPDIVQPLSQHN